MKHGDDHRSADGGGKLPPCRCLSCGQSYTVNHSLTSRSTTTQGSPILKLASFARTLLLAARPLMNFCKSRTAMNTIETAFDILGIPQDSDPKTVMAAWRALVRRYHPSIAKTDPQGANRKLAEINAAFDAVSAAAVKKPSSIIPAREASRSGVFVARGRPHARSKRQANVAQPFTETQVTDRTRSCLAEFVAAPPVVARIPEPAPHLDECNSCGAQSSTSKVIGAPVLLSQRAIAAFETAQKILAGRCGATRTSLYL